MDFRWCTRIKRNLYNQQNSNFKAVDMIGPINKSIKIHISLGGIPKTPLHDSADGQIHF